MSNYTKTTDFEAKDSLPTGDSGKIIRGAEFETEFDAISTAIATKADTAGPTFTGTLTFETISDGTIGVTAFVDEDDMSSDSATLVPTQQSVKAYVDSQVTAQDLDFQADSGGALSIDLDTETMTFTGGTGIDTSGSGNAVTFAIDSTVATLTGTQTLTNKTLTSPDVNTPDIDGGTIDGTVIGGTTPAAVSATTVSATGNITVGGTVDGRDVATDGTKLDGIEAGATADQTAAEIRTLVESATDSNVFTDADHTKLDGIEASADVTDTANVTAAGALMDSELTSEASVKALNQGVATTDSPTFAGVTVNGTVEFDGLSGTGAVSVTDILDQDDMSSNSATALATQQSIKAYVDSQVATADTLSEVLANGNTTGGTDIAVGTGDDITFADSSKAIFGAGSDLQIYHDGSDSVIYDGGTGNLKLLGTNVVINNAGNTANLATFNDGSDVRLFFNGSQKLATTSTGIDVTGVITTDGMTTSADINFGDNDKAVFGAGSDLQIYHDGSNSYIQEAGSGNLYIQGSNAIRLRSSASLENMLEALENGAVTLYHNNSAKLATTSTGIDVTGTVVSDGLTVQATGSSYPLIEHSNGNRIQLQPSYNYYNSFQHTFKNLDGSANTLTVGESGDISFYEDTGTTAKFFWDASLESLGIGTTSLTPTDGANIELSSSTSSRLLLDNTGASGRKYAITSDTSGNLGFYDYDASAFRILVDSSGNVGIGTSSPATELHVDGKILTAGGSASSPALQLNDVNSGLFSAGGNTVAFSTDGTERMRIDSSGEFTLGNPSGGSALQLDVSATGTDGVDIKSLYYAGGYGPMKLHAGGSERMRIDANGNVGINVTPESWLSTYKVLQIGDAGALVGSSDDSFVAVGANAYLDSASSNYEYINSDFATQYYQVDGTHVWRNAASGTADATISWSEAMRIDSSGNLLVGTTDTTLYNNTTGGGFSVSSNGFTQIAKQGVDNADPVLILNQTGLDGEIQRFYKDGSAVGSIGVSSGDLVIGTGVAGVRFKDSGPSLEPRAANGNGNDGGIDLGMSSSRWRDLYLSGGAYLGGVASANLLDDYEEGTWNPTVTTVSGFTVGASPSYSGTYVKIGKKVFIAAKLDFDSSDAVAEGDYVQLGGVPFSPVHAFDGEGVFHVAVNASANRGATGTAYNIGTSLYLWTTHIGSGAQSWASGVYVQMAFEVS